MSFLPSGCSNWRRRTWYLLALSLSLIDPTPEAAIVPQIMIFPPPNLTVGTTQSDNIRSPGLLLTNVRLSDCHNSIKNSSDQRTFDHWASIQWRLQLPKEDKQGHNQKSDVLSIPLAKKLRRSDKVGESYGTDAVGMIS